MTVSISLDLGLRIGVHHEDVRLDPLQQFAADQTHQVGTVAGARPSCIEIPQARSTMNLRRRSSRAG